MSYTPPTSDSASWQPNTGQAQFDVSVVRPINPAIDWIKGVLFPFDFTRWLTLTVPIFFIYCAENLTSGLGQLNNFGGPGPTAPGADGLEDIPGKVNGYLANNMGTVVLVVVAGLVLWTCIVAIAQFLSSRMEFIHIENMITGVPAVAEPWTRLGSLANSLFLFRMMIYALSMLVSVPLAIISFFQFMSFLEGNDSQEVLSLIMGFFVKMIGLLLILSPIFIGIEIVRLFTKDFVVPIMYRRNLRVGRAWGLLWDLVMSNKGSFAIYVLFRMVIAVAMGLIMAILGCLLTLACCIGAIPVIGQMAYLPLFGFRRIYAVLYLEQFGPDWEIFRRDYALPPDNYDGPPATYQY